ncbi:MAG: hypothetical protein K8H87_10855 [Pseudorhodoplanes sp.]|nr:hypothetical protein [Pseudorhodoplanes sp.]
MSDLTYQDVLTILRLIDTAPFSDIEIEFEGIRLKVCRVAQPSRPGVSPEAPCNDPPSHSASKAEPPKAARTSFSPAPQSTEIPDGTAVKPPMEGTFYASPSPGAPPYVEVGRRVCKGDQLGSVEVMKLFTPVTSPCDGTVQAILVANEQSVTKEQILMIIKADVSGTAAGQHLQR